MRNRLIGTTGAIGAVVLLASSLAGLPRDDPSEPVDPRGGCEEEMAPGAAPGFAPRFCVGLPARSAAPEERAGAAATDDQCKNRGVIPGFCPGLPPPAFTPTGRAPGAEGDLVCGETGRASLAPRFCAVLPTVATAAGGPVRPGLAELERATGGPFLAAGNADAFLFLEAALDAQSRARIEAAFSADVVEVERLFAHRFTRAPAVYVFARRGSFALGLSEAFGYPLGVADGLSRDHGGVLLPGSDAALVNWESAGGDLSIVRHELVHAAIREVAGLGRIPAWLDEGLATLGRDLGGAVRDQRDRYAMRALVENGKLELSSLPFSGPLVRHEYVAATEAVDILLGDLGEAGVRRILVAVGNGSPFADAFAAEARVSVAAFAERFVARLRDRLPAARLVTGETAPNGDVIWTALGFREGSPVTVTVTGNAYRLVYHTATDPYGAAEGTFGSTAPPGTYRLAIDDGLHSAGTTLETTRAAAP